MNGDDYKTLKAIQEATKQSKRLNKEFEKEILPVFTCQGIWYAGIDGSICKAIFKATRPGKLESRIFNGIIVRVLPRKAELVNEVKRIGYMCDREAEIQLRLGDTLILYISNTIA